MPANLMVLSRLQQTDTQWEEIQQELESFNSPNGSAALQDIEKQLETAQGQTREEERILKDAELELAALEAEKKSVQGKLFSGKITNPKELSQLEKELQQLDRKRDKLDERILQQMEKVEKTKKDVGTQGNVLGQEKTRLEQEKNARKERKEFLEKRLLELQTKREALAQSLDESLLETYERLKKRKSGLAVVKIKKNSCGGCFMQVPQGLLQKVKSYELEYCSSCGRILYLDKEM